MDTTQGGAMATPLVTTVSGTRDRLQLGSDVTVIDVDSVVRATGATTLIDVLETRVAGLVVLRGSGAPGDPSFLRLRGAGSVSQSNEPLVILNGIRLSPNRTLADGPVNLAGLVMGTWTEAAPSALDQIDPHAVDHIEVLRGPSATALYGVDASAGVILITTKRGTTEGTRWGFSLTGGRASPAETYPRGYLRWGTSVTGPTSDGTCSWSNPTCHVDSLASFQTLNDPRYTPFGHGGDVAATLSASGGGTLGTYALTGSASNTTGLLHLPALEAAHFQQVHGFAPPDWMRDPERYTTWSGTGTATAPIWRGATAALTGLLFDGAQRRSSMEQSIPLLLGAYVGDPTTAQQTGFVPDYVQRVTSDALTAIGALSVQWPVASWLPLNGTFGIDHVRRNDRMIIPPHYTSDADSLGRLQTGDGTAVTQTASVQSVVPISLLHATHLTTALGLSLVRESDMTTVALYAPGVVQLVREGEQTPLPRTTVSGFIQPQLALASSRLFITPGVRWDGIHASRAQGQVAAFPQVTASWIAVQDPQQGILRSLLPLLRLRAAYGDAGGESASGTPVPLLGPTPQTPSFTFLGGPASVYRPERSRELEGGADAELWSHRIVLDVTTYRKTNQDASLVGMSTNGVVELGSAAIRNSGTEISLTAQLARGPRLGWTVGAAFSRNDNLVTRLTSSTGNQGFAVDAFGTRVMAGAPLFGRWALPIVSFADYNGDGLVDSSSIQVGNTPVFLGPELPRTTLGVNSGVTLFGGSLSAYTTVEYQSAVSQFDAAAVTRSADGRFLLDNQLNGPGTTLAQQADVIALDRTPIGTIQSVHALRWRTLAVNYAVPSGVARRMHVPAASLAVQGENLALHTNYRGPDPAVGAFALGNSTADMGQVPLPRTWSVRVNLGK